MNYWFVTHSLNSYKEHPNLIGFEPKELGIPEPRFKIVADIQKGDRIVYYAKKDKVIVGIFNIVSSRELLENDPKWGESVVYKIEPAETPPNDYYLDFKKTVRDKTAIFDFIPHKENYGKDIRKACIKLKEHDYLLIKKYLKNPDFLIKENHLVKRLKKSKKRDEGTLSHDSILDSLMTIGEIFGFEILEKPSVNDLRPRDKPFKAKGKTLDLAWKSGLTYIPFEVQVHGSIPDLLYRLNMVHQWSLKMIVVADQEYHDEIIEAAQGYPFKEKLVLVTPKEIESKKDYDELKRLRDKIFA